MQIQLKTDHSYTVYCIRNTLYTVYRRIDRITLRCCTENWILRTFAVSQLCRLRWTLPLGYLALPRLHFQFYVTSSFSFYLSLAGSDQMPRTSWSSWYLQALSTVGIKYDEDCTEMQTYGTSDTENLLSFHESAFLLLFEGTVINNWGFSVVTSTRDSRRVSGYEEKTKYRAQETSIYSFYK